MTERTVAYHNYLHSADWANLRTMVLHRANGWCELCRQSPVTEVHHVRYPKRFTEDHPDNLLALCGECHDKQHGIRVETMSTSMISGALKVAFVFTGHGGKEYQFEFLMIQNKPWIPIREVEKKLYWEDFAIGSERLGQESAWGAPVQNFTEQGRLLAMKAATDLRPEYRMEADGETWVRASGALQLIAKSASPAGQSFREQLGDWLEDQVIHGQSLVGANATRQALFDAGEARAGNLQALQGLVAAMVKHEEELNKVSVQACEAQASASEAKDIAQATQRLVQDTLAIGYMITDEYIKRVAPEFASSETSQKFGLFIAQQIKKQGGYKTNDGWWINGQQVSKFVPWPGKVNQMLNRWHKEKVLDKAWPIFCHAINPGAGKFNWQEFVASSGLHGIPLELAKACRFADYTNGRLRLELPYQHSPLRVENAERVLLTSLQTYLKEPVRLEIMVPR